MVEHVLVAINHLHKEPLDSGSATGERIAFRLYVSTM